MKKDQINIHDLRLGNFIFGVSDRMETITGLRNTSEGNLITSHPGILLKASFEGSIKDYSGILITEKWFEAFQFQTDSICFWKETFEIGWFKNGFYYLPSRNLAYRSLKKLVYVHELQNLYFIITGEELQVKENILLLNLL